jgi:rhodanese-related sulfurtransferase
MRLTLALVSLLAFGCGAAEVPTAHHPPRRPVDGRQAVRLVVQGAFLLDVSPRLAYYGRHVRGAHNIPVAELPDRMHELPPDATLVVYCRDGTQAPLADRMLRLAGFDVRLLGHLHRWHDRSAPVPSRRAGSAPGDRWRDRRGLVDQLDAPSAH